MDEDASFLICISFVSGSNEVIEDFDRFLALNVLLEEEEEEEEEEEDSADVNGRNRTWTITL